jgi:hypothetical protein
MPWTRLIAFVGAVTLCGCTLIPRATYNIEYDKAVRADLEEKAAEHRRLAEAAWIEAWAAGGGPAPDPGFAEGFVDGFADYLDAGGPGGPPAVPPNHYRIGDGTSPAGRAAAARWADGFVEGARAARASGVRPNTLVPVFLHPEGGDPAGSGGPERLVAPPAPVLPPPRSVGPVPRQVGSLGPWRPLAPSPDDRRTLPPAGP